MGVQHGGDGLDLAVRIEVHEVHRPTLGRLVGVAEESPGDLAGGCRSFGEVCAGNHSPIGEVDPLEERRDDLAELGQHEIRVVDRLGQSGGPHAQEQLLVALA